MNADSPAPVHVIIGATGGIGSVLCRRLAARGARLVIGARDEDRLRALADEPGATALPIDARRIDAVAELVNLARETHDRIDGVANLAGSILLKPAHLTSEKDWRETIAANLDTAFATVRAGVGALRKNENGGSIVLLTSSAATVGLANHEAIAAAKAGVIGLTLSASATYARWGVRVNAVAPGLVETPLTERITGHEVARRASEALHPLGRIGRPEEVASAIDWFLDPEQAWVTGQVLGVDGGLARAKLAPRD